MGNRLITDGMVPFLAVSGASVQQVTDLGIQVGVAVLAMVIGRLLDKLGKKTGIKRVQFQIVKETDT